MWRWVHSALHKGLIGGRLLSFNVEVLAVYKLSSSPTAALMNLKRALYHLDSAAAILPRVVFSIMF